MIGGVLCQRKAPLSTTQILMPLNFTSSFADIKNNHTITVIDAPVINVGDGYGFSKFGNGALYAKSNLSSNYLRIESPPTLDLSGKKPFTIECWAFPNPYYGGSAIFSMRTSNGYCPISLLYTSARIGNSTLTAWNTLPIGTANQSWLHYAVVGDGTNITVYVNGIEKGQVSHPDWPAGDRFLNVGHDPDANSWCYFNDMRVSSSAIYTENFTPPPSPLTV